MDVSTIDSPIYDVLEPLHEDISTDSLQYVEYYDVNLNDADSVDDFRINVSEGEQWFLPAKAYLSVRYKVVDKVTGADVAVGTNVSPQSNAVGLFSRWELIFDNIEAEYVDYAGIQNTVQSLVYFSHADIAKASQQHFFKDTVRDPTSATVELISLGNAPTTTLAENRLINYGRVYMRDLSTNATSLGVASGTNHSNMTAIIPLVNVFGCLKSMTHVTKGMKIGLRLKRESADNSVMASNGAEGRIKFSRVSLWIPRVKPNVTVLSKIEGILAAEAIRRTPFVDTQCFRSNRIGAATIEQIYQIKPRRRRPIKVFVAFQHENRVSPAANVQTRSRRIFDNVGVTSLRAVLNATVQYPEREYSSAFTTNESDFGRVYAEYLRAGLKDHDITDGPAVSYQEFKNLFTIYCIDMSDQMEYQVVPDAALIDVYWKSASTDPYYAWFVVESERKLEISTGDGLMKFIGAN